MLPAGDEMGRTQLGNNNAYCQDNEFSWLDWELDKADRELLNFVQQLIALRNAHPSFCRRRFFEGRKINDENVKDIIWINPVGHEVSEKQWNKMSFSHCLGMYLAGSGIDEYDQRGERISDDDFLLLLNAHHEEVDFQLPDINNDRVWKVLIDTVHAALPPDIQTCKNGDVYSLQSRSLVLLTQVIS